MKSGYRFLLRRREVRVSAARGALCGFLALASMLMMGSGAARASGASKDSGGALPGWVMDIPLSKVLPTQYFAVLGEGVVHGRRWGVYTFANGRPGAKQRPCIENVTLRYVHGTVATTNGAPSCGKLAPPNAVPVTTEYVFTNVAGLVIGMTLDPTVAAVRLGLSKGPVVKMATRRLSKHQAEKARVMPFRYMAMGFGRRACLESIQGLSASGDTLFETAPLSCVI